MAVLCKPVVEVPEHVITRDETLELCRRLHADHPRLDLALRLIANTGVEKRHVVRPIDEILRHPGFESRNNTYVEEAKQRLPGVVLEALGTAGLGPADIDLIIYVSCTGFTMPSMTAWLINNMGFSTDTRQLPIAQLGCAAGGAAINRAHDFCCAYEDANVLIVACEFSSLCYQPDDKDVGNLLSNGLFGDAVAATVMRGKGGTGFQVELNGSYLMPNTEPWIRFDVKSTGFHFMLDERVPGTMTDLAPSLAALAKRQGWDAADLDFYIVHAGGPRILTDLSAALGVDQARLEVSRSTLVDYGNIASAVVLETLRRTFEQPPAAPGATGLLAGFGPGITAEVALGTWVTDEGAVTPSRDEPSEVHQAMVAAPGPSASTRA